MQSSLLQVRPMTCISLTGATDCTLQILCTTSEIPEVAKLRLHQVHQYPQHLIQAFLPTFNLPIHAKSPRNSYANGRYGRTEKPSLLIAC